jgi:hypothetical protein
MEKLPKLVLPLGSLILGAVTGFVIRDELSMPTYMRIKMSTVEYHIMTRKRLSPDLLTIID